MLARAAGGVARVDEAWLGALADCAPRWTIRPLPANADADARTIADEHRTIRAFFMV